MNIIKRIPSDKELENAKYNRKIEIIQTICHIAAGILVFAGCAHIIYGSCAIEANEVFRGAMAAIDGLASVGFGALLANM